ncbi:TNFR-Cys domain-containing protein [Candidatus Electrothrix laxa]
MKSIFTISFLVTLLLTAGAGTALSYDCYERTPPQIRPYTCSQCQKPQCNQPPQPCSTRCGQCDKCNKSRIYKPSCQKKVKHRHSYQCETTCTKKTEQITTIQCKLCGTRYQKGVEHYCNRAQCRSCGQVHPRDVAYRCGIVQCRTCGQTHSREIEHRCGTVQCNTCGIQYPQGMRHRCDEVRTRHQDCSQGDCFQGNTRRYEGKQCATRGCNFTRKESKETMETRWHTWFKNQAREETVF